MGNKKFSGSNVSELNDEVKKKRNQSKSNEPSEPCRVTARKGTLAHLNQRQKRQKFLLQQQQEYEAVDDFFDDANDPLRGNFHAAKYQISDFFLNSSTTFTSFNSGFSSFSHTPPSYKIDKKCNSKKQDGIGDPSMASFKGQLGINSKKPIGSGKPSTASSNKRKGNNSNKLIGSGKPSTASSNKRKGNNSKRLIDVDNPYTASFKGQKGNNADKMVGSVNPYMASLKGHKGNNANKQVGSGNPPAVYNQRERYEQNQGTELGFDGVSFSPRSALLARFAGDESDGRGFMVSTPTNPGRRVELGVNLGLAVTPGELLQQSVVNRITYNNKRKRPRKRLVFTSPPRQDISSLVDSCHTLSSSQSRVRKSSKRFSDGLLGQSPDNSRQKSANHLPQLPEEFSPAAGAKKLKRLKLPRIEDDLTIIQDEDGSDYDDYFKDSDH